MVLPRTKEKRKIIFEMLSEMDIPIKDIRIEKDEDGNIRNIYTKHLMENGKHIRNDEAYGDMSPSGRCPATRVYQLVENLWTYL